MIQEFGQVYVFGGRGNNGRMDSIECYNDVEDKWIVLNVKIPCPLEGGAIEIIKDKYILIFGGRANDKTRSAIYMADLEEKGIAKMKFEKVGEMKVRQAFHKVIRTKSNELITFGGNSKGIGFYTVKGGKLVDNSKKEADVLENVREELDDLRLNDFHLYCFA